MKVRTGPKPDGCFADVLIWYNDGIRDLVRGLRKCPRRDDWNVDLASQTVALFLEPQLATDLEQASYLAADVRMFADEMGLSHTDLLGQLLTMPAMHVLSQEARSWLIMESFAIFHDDYAFANADGARMGSAVASMALPLDQVLNLITELSEHEGRAEDQGWVNGRYREATVAFVRTWAHDAAFPHTWAGAALSSFLRALRGWDDALKKGLTRLVLGWVEAALQPLVHVLGESPSLDVAMRLLAALQ